MRAMFLAKFSTSTLGEAVGTGEGMGAGGCAGLRSGAGATTGSCDCGLVEGFMPHLALDILAGYAKPNQFKALTPDFVGHIDFTFPTRSLQLHNGRYRVFLLR